MNSQGFLIEKIKLCAAGNGIVPQNMTGATPTSAWIGLKAGRRACITIVTGAWAGGTSAVTLLQASDNTGTGSKALAMSRYWLFPASGAALTTPATGTANSDTPAETAVISNTFNIAATANTAYVIEVDCGDLDQNNGFSYFSLNLATPGSNADLICAIIQVYDLGISGKPATLPSALA